MDKGVTDGKPEMKNNGSPQKVGNEDHAGGENDCELNSLLPPSTGGMSRKPEKKGRKVRWNDSSGNKLFEVLEFHPSDISDSEYEESDSCICTVM